MKAAILTSMALGAVCSVASAAPIISQNGLAYTSVSASTFLNANYTPDNLFDQNPTVGQQMSTGGDAGIAWAAAVVGDGSGPHFVEFELDDLYTVESIFHSNRDFNNAGNSAVDKVTNMRIWASSVSAFAAANPGTSPDGSVAVTEVTSSNFTEYTLSSPIVGRYFVVEFTGDPNVGVIGGVELRLGGEVVPEPTSLGIAGLLAGFGLLRRRFRR